MTTRARQIVYDAPIEDSQEMVAPAIMMMTAIFRRTLGIGKEGKRGNEATAGAGRRHTDVRSKQGAKLEPREIWHPPGPLDRHPSLGAKFELSTDHPD